MIDGDDGLSCQEGIHGVLKFERKVIILMRWNELHSLLTKLIKFMLRFGKCRYCRWKVTLFKLKIG